jgi:peptidoglycan hydrolase CwlO-like protein
MVIFLRLKRVCKSIWQWIKKYWKWVVGGLTLLVLLILIAKAVARGSQGKLKAEMLKHQVKILTMQREISRLEGQRDIIRQQASAVTAEIDQLDAKIDALDTQIASSRKEIDRLSAEEKLRRFKELGY